MRLRSLAITACLCVSGPTTSIAATLTVLGIDYNVTTVEGSFVEHEELLRQQVWFGDEDLARAFATADLEDTLFPDFPSLTVPVFAFEGRRRSPAEGPSVSGYFAGPANTFAPFLPSGPAGTQLAFFSGRDVRSYAIATRISAVPLPTGGFLLLSGFVGIAALKCRKKRAA